MCAHWVVGKPLPDVSRESLEAHKHRFATFYERMGVLEPHRAGCLSPGKPLGDSLSLLLNTERQGEVAPVEGGASCPLASAPQRAVAA